MGIAPPTIPYEPVHGPNGLPHAGLFIALLWPFSANMCLATPPPHRTIVTFDHTRCPARPRGGNCRNPIWHPGGSRQVARMGARTWAVALHSEWGTCWKATPRAGRHGRLKTCVYHRGHIQSVRPKPRAVSSRRAGGRTHGTTAPAPPAPRACPKVQESNSTLTTTRPLKPAQAWICRSPVAGTTFGGPDPTEFGRTDSSRAFNADLRAKLRTTPSFGRLPGASGLRRVRNLAHAEAMRANRIVARIAPCHLERKVVEQDPHLDRLYSRVGHIDLHDDVSLVGEVESHALAQGGPAN